MQHRIDRLEEARRRCLFGFLVAFVAWQLPTIAQEALGTALPAAWSTALGLIAAVAGLLWLVYAVRLWRLRRAIGRDGEVATALDDERVDALRLRALTFGFWSLLVYLAGARLASFATPLSASVVSQLGLVVAAVAAISAFLYLDREGSQDGRP